MQRALPPAAPLAKIRRVFVKGIWARSIWPIFAILTAINYVHFTGHSLICNFG
jgi:hypothetical protein